jgi:hypothetical protein
MPKLNTIPTRVQDDSIGGIVKVIYDFADVGGKVGNIPLELELPVGTIIYGGFIDVVTAIAGGANATFGLSFIDNAKYAVGSSATPQVLYGATNATIATGVTRLFSTGTSAVTSVPSGTTSITLTTNTFQSPALKLTTGGTGGTKCVLNAVVATADLTAGKANIYLQYFGVA